jgi:excisionase family DNA binding protein
VESTGGPMTRIFANLNDYPPIMNVEQVAALLGRSQSSIRELLKAGEIKGKLVGRRWYVSRDSIQQLIQND